MTRKEIISRIINILKNYEVTDSFAIMEQDITIGTGITRKNIEDLFLTITEIEENIKEKLNIDALLFNYFIHCGTSEEDYLYININNMIVNKAMLYKYIEIYTKKILCEKKNDMIINTQKTLQISLPDFTCLYSSSLCDVKKEEIELIIEHNIEEIFKFIDYKSSVIANERIDKDDMHKYYSIDINIELTNYYGMDFVLSIIKNFLYPIIRPEIMFTYYKITFPISEFMLYRYCIKPTGLLYEINKISYDNFEYNIYINDDKLLELEARNVNKK